MKNWLQNTKRVLNNVAEVVAPTPKSPLETFKQHWNAIKNFYIDELNDVSPLVCLMNGPVVGRGKKEGKGEKN
jgi:hypothetical protein